MPYSEVDPAKLAGFFYGQARINKAVFLGRMLPGFVERYGESRERALDNVKKGVRDHEAGESQHLVVAGSDGELLGAASITDDELRRLRLPVIDRLGVWPLAKTYGGAGWQVKAWTAETGFVRPELTHAYTVLGGIVTAAARERGDRCKVTYALEPRPMEQTATASENIGVSNLPVHTAIARAGMVHATDGRFADNEDGWTVPPVASLYTAQPYDMLGLRPEEMHDVIRGGAAGKLVEQITRFDPQR